MMAKKRLTMWSVLLPILTILSSPVLAQNINWNLVDTGVLKHSVHGQGIEMRIKPSAPPPGGLQGEFVRSVLGQICRHYAPSVIPFVREQTGTTELEFIAVRVVSGNAVFGSYVLQAYEIDGETCGNEL